MHTHTHNFNFLYEGDAALSGATGPTVAGSGGGFLLVIEIRRA
jgi:hypothetical protein